MSISVNLHRTKKVWTMTLEDNPTDALHFEDDEGSTVVLFLPPHVCTALETAFNEATKPAFEEVAA